MPDYVVLIDGEPGAYGAAFPDCPGCTAMGATVEDTLGNAVEALHEWMADRIAAGFAPPEPRTPEQIDAEPSLAEALSAARIAYPALPCGNRPLTLDTPVRTD
jgi:predicted RNase H-like HicB family nuclease